MSKWLPDVTLAPIAFDGDSVVFRIKRLLVEDLNVLMSNYDRATGKLLYKSPEEVAEIAAKVVPKYVLAVDGLRKGDGAPFTLEEFLSVIPEAYFMPLVGALLVGLMSESVVKNEKNSVAPPPEQPAASGAENPAT